MACLAPVLVAIWGLETDYGAGFGGYPTFSALATLAYDCRRAQVYRAELIDALMLVQRGLLRPSQRGAWAGEIGQTQFMPSAYLKFAVNVEGGGRAAILFPVPPTRWPRPRTSCARTAGVRARAGTKASRISTPCCNGTRPPVYAKTVALFADKLAGRQ